MKIKEKTKAKIQVSINFVIMVSMFIAMKILNVTTVTPENTIIAGSIMLPSAILVMSVWIIGDRI